MSSKLCFEGWLLQVPERVPIVRLGERKQNPTESKSRRLIVLCSGGRWFSPPPGAASSRLFYCFYGVNCSISMSLMNWFRSGFMVSLQGTLRRALACLFSDGESRGYWVRWLLVGGWERASQAPATVKLGDLVHSWDSLVSGLSYDV